MNTKPRLEGLDLARFVAFVGMVLVNFRIVMAGDDHSVVFVNFLEGKAAALFVVLAGVGLGLAAQKGRLSASVTLKRAAFLMALGLLNMFVFPADIIHYYAVYFAIGVWFLGGRSSTLLWMVTGVILLAVAGLVGLNYDTGWNWDTLEYTDFWTPAGFVRNLFYNGWHPVFPWIGFLFFGFWLAKRNLSEAAGRMLFWGSVGVIATVSLSRLLIPVLATIDPELAALAGTSPVPPVPLYMAIGISAATAAIGGCLLVYRIARFRPVLDLLTKAGRISLTLYIAHILIGMGMMEALGLIENATEAQSVLASLMFCAGSVGFALLWLSRFKAGPLETLMRKLAG
ncbi:MAG: DUF418 domain-containing protein [Rhodobacteraceae bacterium]|nr:DUF418 domain-containing protein [Paracoccaceae bacterium]